MKRINVLGLLALAALAIAAFAGTSSSLAAENFTAGQVGKELSETTLKNHVLTFTGKSLECTTIGFEGTTAGTDYESQTVSPSYSGCKAFGFETGVSVDVNGCNLTFGSKTSSGMATVSVTGCGSGTAEDKAKGIQVTVNTGGNVCTIDIPEQSISSAVSYANGEKDLKIAFTGTAIEFNVTTSSGSCPLTTGTHSEGNGASYSGESTVQAASTTLAWDAAEKGVFTAGKAGAALSETRLSNHVTSITGNKIECEVINFTGETTSVEASKLTMSPSFEKCVAFGFAEVAVDINGCEFVFQAKTTGSHAAWDLTGCGSGTAEDKAKGIQRTVKVPFVAECITDIPEQWIANAVSYANGENDLRMKFTATGIEFNVTKSTGLCPLTTGTHSGENGASYVGESTFQAAGTSLTWSNV